MVSVVELPDFKQVLPADTLHARLLVRNNSGRRRYETNSCATLHSMCACMRDIKTATRLANALNSTQFRLTSLAVSELHNNLFLDFAVSNCLHSDRGDETEILELLRYGENVQGIWHRNSRFTDTSGILQANYEISYTVSNHRLPGSFLNSRNLSLESELAKLDAR